MSTDQDKSMDGVALIVGGLFVLALVFGAYNYFNKGATTENSGSKEETTAIEKIREAIAEKNDVEEETEGDVNGNGVTTKAGAASGNEKDATTTSVFASTWHANDYKEGDIKVTSYTVKHGDSLWEIAEGAYGNGTQWTKILNANNTVVSYLPNGQQALIFPNQVLVLP